MVQVANLNPHKTGSMGCRDTALRVPTNRGHMVFISEEHIYRWNCPKCGHDNTAYYKQAMAEISCRRCSLAFRPVEKTIRKTDCTNCAGCDYYCRKEAEMLGELNEIADIEKMNFLAWYRDATVEEIAIARRNNAAKLDELKKKYAAEIALMDVVGRRTDGTGLKEFLEQTSDE